MFVSSGCMIINLVGEYLELEWIKTASYIVSGVIIVITLIYVNVKKTPIKKL
ncbi:hypothetical protein [Alkalibaculum sporogenes]|uniref:hypothetical protein n=1 Tax=Alkalibaculum sporogenes TaxID=2655001 RepID=UPI001A9A987B|nr:hypothetical protein [Alkalibaculum sporogenes]